MSGWKILQKKEIQKEKNDAKFEELIKSGLEKASSIALVNEAIKVANSAVDSAKWGFFPTPSVDVYKKAQLLKQQQDQINQYGLVENLQVLMMQHHQKDEMKISLEESKYNLIDNFIAVLQTYLVAKAQIESFDKW